MEEQNFKMQFEIHYHEVNPYEKATPLTILHFLEDAAIAHSESVGQGVKQLQSRKQAWILNRWLLQMERYPELGEKVIIETWSSGFERFYGSRDYLIKDEQKKIFGRATSLWIFYNTATQRPARIPADFQGVYGLNPVRAIEEPLDQLQIEVGEQERESELIFRVRRSDIDTNGHVNNANYLQWMLEVVPEDIFQNHHLATLEINYKKATTYGSSILSKCFVAKPRVNNTACRHAILGEDGLQELAIAKTVWLER